MIPDTLDLLTISVRAGLGFDAALAKVVEKLPGPLTDEFRRALAEVRVGKARRDALRDMIPRTNVQPLSNFIGAIIQAETLGVSISKVLQVQSEQLRIERRQRAEEQAARAPIKMLFPLSAASSRRSSSSSSARPSSRSSRPWGPAPCHEPAASDRPQRQPRNLLAERLEDGASFWAKFMGLMGRASLPAGDGLWLPGENGIHMLFMRFPIDVVFVSPEPADLPGLDGHLGPPRVPPWRGVVWRVGGAKGCWSLPVGTIEASGTAVGDEIAIDPG